MALTKFKSMVHYVINECADYPAQLGAIRLNKVLWFADVTAYKLDGKSITGERYVKRQFGPAPARILPILAELEKSGDIVVMEPEFAYDTRKFISLKPSTGRLSNREKLITSAVLNGVLGRTANAISEMSHDQIWDAAKEGEEIPLHATLAATPGEITPEVIEWATQCLKDRASAEAATEAA